MRESGIFFSKVVVILGFVQLALGTIGLIIVGNQTVEDCYESWFGTTRCDDTTPFLGYALAAIIPNLLISSLLIAFGCYINVKLQGAKPTSSNLPIPENQEG